MIVMVATENSGSNELSDILINLETANIILCGVDKEVLDKAGSLYQLLGMFVDKGETLFNNLGVAGDIKSKITGHTEIHSAVVKAINDDAKAEEMISKIMFSDEEKLQSSITEESIPDEYYDKLNTQELSGSIDTINNYAYYILGPLSGGEIELIRKKVDLDPTKGMSAFLKQFLSLDSEEINGFSRKLHYLNKEHDQPEFYNLSIILHTEKGLVLRCSSVFQGKYKYPSFDLQLEKHLGRTIREILRETGKKSLYDLIKISEDDINNFLED